MQFQRFIPIAAISAAYMLSPVFVTADEFDVSVSGQVSAVLAALGDPVGLDGAQIDLVTSFDGCSPASLVNGQPSVSSISHTITVTGSVAAALDGTYTSNGEIGLVPSGALGDAGRSALVSDTGIVSIVFGPGLQLTVVGAAPSPAVQSGDTIDNALLTQLSFNGGGITVGDQSYEFSSITYSHARTAIACASGSGGEENPALATDDSYNAIIDTLLTVAAAQGVLANDSDPEGDPFTASLLTDVSNGVLSLAADGSFTYTPNTAFTGQDSFTYQVTGGDSATATIDVAASGLVGHWRLDETSGTTAADSSVNNNPGTLQNMNVPSV